MQVEVVVDEALLKFLGQPLIDAVAEAIGVCLDQLNADFYHTTATWNHQPQFVTERQAFDSGQVYTDDEIYGWVNDGTESHEITPAGKRVLVFATAETGLVPKTEPGVIDSATGSRGFPGIYTKRVFNPGIDPRRFDQALARKWEDVFPQIVQAAIDRVAGV